MFLIPIFVVSLGIVVMEHGMESREAAANAVSLFGIFLVIIGLMFAEFLRSR